MIHTELKVAGQYKLVKTSADGSVEETPWSDNMILDAGLARMGASAEAVFSYLQVGKGTLAVAAAQTRLNSWLGGTPIGFESTASSGAPLYKADHLYKAVFAQGAIVGNITEVGVGTDDLGEQNLFSRSLITDGAGVPTSMAIVAMDQLTVFYKLTVTPPLTNGSGSFVIGGVTYGYTSRISQVESFSYGYYVMATSDYSTLCTSMTAYGGINTLSPVNEAGPLGGESFGSSSFTTHLSYNAATRTRTTRVTFSIDSGNGSGGITAFTASFGVTNFQYVLNKAIPKTNTKVLTLDIAISWSRG